MKLHESSVLDKILLLLLRGNKKAIQKVVSQDPELQKSVRDLEQQIQHLKSTGDNTVKRIQNKYKGTPYEKYFK